MDESDETKAVELAAALYALGQLADAERAAFEALLRDPKGVAATRLREFSEVILALAARVPNREPPAGLRARLLEQAGQAPRQPSEAAQIELAPGVRLVLVERLAWQDTPVPGVSFKRLFIDHARRYAHSLVTMAAGATYPRHRHADVEEIILLAGDAQIARYTLRSGDYCRAEAGTVHEAIHSENGCTFIALASLDDEIVER
ncbi:MAG: cupin domain-containing protein [Gammaproteobacteria bacterium]